MKKLLHAFFSGAVQGVGFRYTTRALARRFPVTGFVKNLPDGRVELVAEGEERVLEEFLAAVREEFQPYIRHIDVDWKESLGASQGFEIAF